MITLERDGIVMGVATELQASVFLRSGYKRVGAPAEDTPARNFATEAEKETAPKVAEPEPEMPVEEEQPKRRRRKKTE